MRTKDTIFTNEELKRIFQYLDESIIEAQSTYLYLVRIRNRAIIELMYYGALSSQEMELLELSDYDCKTRTLTLPNERKGWNNTTVKIMDKQIAENLEYHLEVNHPKEYLFENIRNGEPMTKRGIDEIVSYVCSHASIDEKKSKSITFKRTMIKNVLESSNLNYICEGGIL